MLRRWLPLIAQLAVIAVYLPAYLLLEPLTGRSIDVLMIAPVVAASWFYGWPGGVLAMAVYILIDATLLHVVHPSLAPGQTLGWPDAPAIAVAWLAAFVFGRWRDLDARWRAALVARVEVEAESKSINRFLAHMNHELRTPLNSILGFSQLLAHHGSNLTDGQRRQVGHIQSSGIHMLTLVGDILDLSKVTAGQMEISLDQVELAALLRETTAKMQPIAEERRLELVLEAPPELLVRADRRRLFQVLLNLLSNASKFTPAGGRISVGARCVGEMVEVSVADTGVGVDLADQERIFEEFVQVGARPASEENRGSGLGLAMSRRLLTLMHGSIRVESSPGEGSVFTISVPLARPRLLLVVDEDESSLLSRLKDAAYEIVHASDVRKAIDLVARRKPALILLGQSIDREEMDWFRAQLSSRPGSAAIPVLARTADRAELLRSIAGVLDGT